MPLASGLRGPILCPPGTCHRLGKLGLEEAGGRRVVHSPQVRPVVVGSGGSHVLGENLWGFLLPFNTASVSRCVPVFPPFGVL